MSKSNVWHDCRIIPILWLICRKEDDLRLGDYGVVIHWRILLSSFSLLSRKIEKTLASKRRKNSGRLRCVMSQKTAAFTDTAMIILNHPPWYFTVIWELSSVCCERSDHVRTVFVSTNSVRQRNYLPYSLFYRSSLWITRCNTTTDIITLHLYCRWS